MLPSGFSYKNNILHCSEVPVDTLADQFSTPSYVYSGDAIKAQIKSLQEAFARYLPEARQPRFCYACKANSNIHVLSLIREAGADLEIVSQGELVRGLKAGFRADQIVSTGVGKTAEEIKACLEAGIHQLNVESLEELRAIAEIAESMGKVAPVVFRLNPDIAAGGDDKIMTGRTRDKFGIGPDRILEAFDLAATMPSVNALGLSMHIGSQIHEIWLYRQAYAKLGDIVKTLRGSGHTIERLDIGGGFGICYQNETPLDPAEIAKAVRDLIEPLGTQILMEPGRFITGNSGIILSKILYIKKTADKNFLILDQAMNDLMRPSLYDAWHGLVPVVQGEGKQEMVSYDIVGPVCETGDTFARERLLPELQEGDLVAILGAGAYAASMASNYNTRPLLAEILVNGSAVKQVRKRQSYDDILKLEEDV